MHALTPQNTGARIARARKLRRLSQRELASLSAVSYSTLTKVEQDRLPASPSVLGALARALSMPVEDLTGQPYIEDLQADALDGLIHPIREAMNLYDVGVDVEVRPRPLGELADQAEALCAEVRATNIKKVAAELPSLIIDATAIAHTETSDRAWQVLASSYRTAYDVTAKLGYLDLCTVALDRLDWAAHRASDPILSSMRQYMRALAYLRSADYATGKRLIAMGQRILEQAPAGRERDVIAGQLHLGASVLAGRDKDKDKAEHNLFEADRLAKATGPAEKVHWLSFGPLNVAVHKTSVLAELDDYQGAVDSGQKIKLPDTWPRSRSAHHHAEMARSLMWTGRAEGAFKALQEARRLAPQQTRYHPTVRETYAHLDAQKRRLPETFAGYGAWLGR